ncbi:MAG: hypothetical protein LBL63_03355, partial [Clostridiales Family XIII bacterium]|nr:hypothetical protein [Clostridiales Family XIII bacterium]
LGVDGGPLAGALDWAPAAADAIPGADDTALNPAGYAYDVVFAPDDDVNYTTLAGTASVPVGKAVPVMAGGAGARPQGSTIFQNPPGNDTLADSAVTGDVVISVGGVVTGLSGTWAWDVPGTEKFTSDGMKARAAVFTPDDARADILRVAADFAVYSPKTEIRTEPALGAGRYGGKVGDVPFTGKGLVTATSADGGPAEDITAKGAWSWKNPDLALTSTTGAQTAVAVFTPGPGYLADFGDNPPHGYVAAEKELTIDIAPATPTVDASGAEAPLISFGDALLAAGDDPGGLGHAFAGTAAFGHTALAGTLAWEAEDPSAVVPGAAGYETSADEGGNTYNVKEDGVFCAPAVFTPSDSYGSAYAPLRFFVKISVGAAAESKAVLSEVVSEGGRAVLPPVSAAKENYAPGALDRYAAALEAAKAAAGPDAPLLTQAGSERLFAGLEAAAAALVHDHPLLSNSAEGGVKRTGEGADIRIKGDYGSADRLTLNGKDFVLAARSGDGPRAASFDGKAAGSISKGSLEIKLAPAFMDTLPNGSYRIVAHFRDGYAEGSGAATFVIDRPAAETPGDPGDGGTAGPGGGGTAGATGAGGGSGSGNAAPGNAAAGSSGPAAATPGGNAADNAADNAAGDAGASANGNGGSGDNGGGPEPGAGTGAEGETGGANIALWIALVSALVILALVVVLIRRRRSREENPEARA